MINVGITDGEHRLGVSEDGKMPVAPRDTDFTVRCNNLEVPNYEHFAAIGYMPNLATTFETVWPAPNSFERPSGPEAYELVCANANDDIAGTGARLILVVTLDAAGLVQQQVVATNGGTVQLTGLHLFPRNMIVLDSGSLDMNAGDITLQVSGGGGAASTIRNYMLAEDSNALSAIYRVPSNKIFHLIGLDYHTGGTAKKVTLKSQIMLPDGNTWITTSRLPILQQSFTASFKISAKYDPGTLVRYTAKVSSGGGSGDDIAVILLGYEVDI